MRQSRAQIAKQVRPPAAEEESATTWIKRKYGGYNISSTSREIWPTISEVVCRANRFGYAIDEERVRNGRRLSL